MLTLFVVIYLLLTVVVGLLASRLVKNSNDFILAGKKLPLAMATATVFATWFGSETVLGASFRMAEKGLQGVIEDPFGASLCLILVGLFFARPLYRMKLLTFGDFYKITFGKRVELVASVFLVLSYFGWIAAQLAAMGIVIHAVSGLETHWGIVLSTLVVLAYTYMGGMWAVSVTDFIQMFFIIIGIVCATVSIVGDVGGIGVVLDKTPKTFFQLKGMDTVGGWLSVIAALITLGLGSIPQQDVFQRVMSSKSEKVAVRSSILAAIMYLTIALFPLLLGLTARILAPDEVNSQQLLPQLILQKSNLFIQILFFGALLSAIMSTASGAILAPAVILSENIILPHFNRFFKKKELASNRVSVVLITLISLVMALMRRDIYELVGEASAISLVSLFVPLTAGIFFKSRSETGAMLSVFSGMVVWLLANNLDTFVPSVILGLSASTMGFIIGSIFDKSRNPLKTQ